MASIHHYAERLLGHKVVENKESVDFRKGAIYYYKDKDLHGNYVHVSGGYSGDYFMGMWKMDDGRDLVGVTHHNCQAVCVYECTFFAFSEEDSTDVSPEIFPLKKMVKQMNKLSSKVRAQKELSDEEAQFKFVIPRDQGVLQVMVSMNRNQIEFPLMDLEWNGVKFVVKHKYNEIPEL